MNRKYRIGLLSTALTGSLLAGLPANLFAEELPAACTPPQMDAWSCYWLEGKITENMCGGALAPDIPRIQQEAEQGNHAAAYRLGQLYAAATWGIERDYEKALKWLQQSAEGGHRDGQIELARMYELGRGTEVNLQQALHWYEQAVKQGPYRGIHNKIEVLKNKIQGIKKKPVH